MKRVVIILIAIILPLTWLHESYSEDTIIAMPENAILTNFLGFGAEWDSRDYAANDITSVDFDLITSRIQWMRLPIVRMMMVANYCYLGNGTFNWNSPQMLLLYRNLDYCQKQGIKVILVDWGAEHDMEWLRSPGIKGASDPEYAVVIANYMDYLVNKKGYNCIKYFTLVNEPDLFLRDWNRWKEGVTNVWNKFENKGLNQKVKILGPDTTSKSEEWTQKTYQQLSSIISNYDVHYYSNKKLVEPGGFEQYLLSRYKYILSDKLLRGNAFIIAEAGMNDDAKHPVGNPHIDEYGYGMFMADYAIQAVRAGSSAVLAWMLDDNSLRSFYWGMWGNKNRRFELRPWFYPWALLSRYFPTDSVLYCVQQPPSLRILVARIPSSNNAVGDDWTFCMINRDSVPRTINLKVTEGGLKNVKRFVYSQEASAKDSKGFPLPTSKERVNLKSGLNVVCPANSMLMVTSLD
jgi:hypothetical protein